MEPIRFADILFICITLVITFTILWLVNKARTKSKTSVEDNQAGLNETVVPDKQDS